MKKIKYEILQNSIADENGTNNDFLLSVEMPWSEAAEDIAKREAFNGAYTIYDDGDPEPEKVVTTGEIIDALLGVTV